MKSLNILFKRWFKTRFFRVLVCTLIASYIRFLYYTSRKIIDIHPSTEPYMHGEKPVIFAFWHARLLMMPMIKPKKRTVQVMISTHRDGEVIALTMHKLNLPTIRGSSTRGGASVTMQAIKALQAGDSVAITPDGPRGPAMKVQQGIIYISEAAGVPIIPVAYAASRHRRMRSWDRFIVVLPFGRLHFAVGAPLFGASSESLEAAMMELIHHVDASV